MCLIQEWLSNIGLPILTGEDKNPLNAPIVQEELGKPIFELKSLLAFTGKFLNILKD